MPHPSQGTLNYKTKVNFNCSKFSIYKNSDLELKSQQNDSGNKIVMSHTDLTDWELLDPLRTQAKCSKKSIGSVFVMGNEGLVRLGITVSKAFIKRDAESLLKEITFLINSAIVVDRIYNGN